MEKGFLVDAAVQIFNNKARIGLKQAAGQFRRQVIGFEAGNFIGIMLLNGNFVGKNIGEMGFAAALGAVYAGGEVSPVRPGIDQTKSLKITFRHHKIVPSHVRAVIKFQRQLFNIIPGHVVFPQIIPYYLRHQKPF